MAMSTVTVKRNESKKTYVKKIEQLVKSLEGVRTAKYCGVLSRGKEPLEYQKEMRDEW